MPPRPVRRAALAAFLVLLGLWTWKLVEPNPFPKTRQTLGPWWALLAAKGLHSGGYATLTVLGLVWASGRTSRRAVVGFLLLHGVGTEIAQTYVPGREGRVRDVLIDWAGIAAGLAVVRAFVRLRLNPGPVFPTRRAARVG